MWDPINNKWRTLPECVWESKIDLRCKFVITSSYDESVVFGLFQEHLKTDGISAASLVEELQYMKEPLFSDSSETFIKRAAAIYTYLLEISNATEDVQKLR